MTPSPRWPAFRRRPGARHGAVVLAAGYLLTTTALSGCSSSPTDKTYVYDASDSPVKVDTPALRREKAAADIAACPVTPTSPGAATKGLPEVTLPCLGGGRDVQLAGLRGPLLLNFWAQTCGPCKSESPILQQLHEAAGDKLLVVGVDWQDSQPGRAIAFADELGLTYPQLADPAAATRAPLRIQGLPITLFVDSTGSVTHAEYGALGSYDEAAGLVDRYLGVRVDAKPTQSGAQRPQAGALVPRPGTQPVQREAQR